MSQYGTPESVAGMAKLYTDNGDWKDPNPTYDLPGTNPTLSQVNEWLVNISAQFDVALGNHWFVFPIDPVRSPTVYKAVSQYIASLVADLCHFANSSGRFFTDRLVERGVTPMAAILTDLSNWIDLNSGGLVADHVPQKQATSEKKEIKFRVIGNLTDD